MFFDAHITVGDLEIVQETDHVVIVATIMMAIPAGQNTIMPLPVGTLRFPVTREGAIAKGQALVEAGEAIPEPQSNAMADFIVANDMTQVEQAAKQVDQITKAAKGQK